MTLVKSGTPALLKLLLKAGTGGLVDSDAVNAISEVSEKFAKEQIKKYEASKNTVAKFKKKLEELAAKLGKSTDEENREITFPLVIFIDELDRCRPTYAIEILEKVKHFFNVPNVIFVVALDKEELGHSIKCIYGQEFGVEGYLRRFIDLDYRLPEPDKLEFCKAQFDIFGLKDYFEKRPDPQDHLNLLTTMSELASLLSCSLREQERCFSLLRVVMQTVVPTQPIFPLTLSTLLILKVKIPQLYGDFIAGTGNVETILNYFRKRAGGQAFMESRKGAILEAYLRGSRINDDDIRALETRYTAIRDDAQETESGKKRAKVILAVFEDLDSAESWNFLESLVAKIDIAERLIR